MKKLGLLLVLFSPAALLAQFGPGGVGTTADNGLWLDANRLTLNNGDPVNSWTDFSGNGNDAADSGVPTEIPVFNSAGSINGRPTITFDGTDQLIVPDADILDDTQGLTYYTIVRPTGLSGAPRGIVGKRITFTTAVEYAYTFFFWSGNHLNLDVHTQNNRFNTNPTSYNNGTNYMPGFIFDGTLPTGQRSKIYEAGTMVRQGNEASTAIPNSGQDLCIGALNVNYGQYFIGEMAEVCQWNYALNTAERIIVENYLGAKYNIRVANDYYAFDMTHAGEVAGIGRVDASNLHDDSQGSAMVRINSPSNLDDGEFMIWGHNEASLADSNTVDVDGAIIESRMERVWRVDTTGDVGTVTVAFDMTGFSPLTGSDLRLLIDRDGDGFFDNDIAPQSGTFAAGTITFTGVQFEHGDFFTLGSINEINSPLPVELLSFSGSKSGQSAKLNWQTASEINASHFTVYRSTDGMAFEPMAQVSASGNSATLLSYSAIDSNPAEGLNFYRLSQTDLNGTEYFYNTVVLDFTPVELNFSVYPNPSNGQFVLSGPTDMETVPVKLIDLSGREVPISIQSAGNEMLITPEYRAAGTYILLAEMEDQLVQLKVHLK